MAAYIAIELHRAALRLNEQRFQAVCQVFHFAEADGPRRSLQAVRAPRRFRQVGGRGRTVAGFTARNDLANGFEVFLVLDGKDLEQPLLQGAQTAYLSIA
jgi:hypothetical protein